VEEIGEEHFSLLKPIEPDLLKEFQVQCAESLPSLVKIHIQED
jgi:hypothetical protein